MRTVMFVGAGQYQVPGIVKAKEMGLHVVAVDGNPNAEGLILADHGCTVDVRNESANITLARRHTVDGVLTIASDVSVRTVAAVAEALDLTGISRDAAERATDKRLMREAFERAGLPGPKVVVVRPDDIVDAGSLEYPVVVKPTDSAGSRGVRLVSRAAELTDAIRRAREYSRSGTVLIETFVQGHECSIEAFVWEGRCRVLAMSDKVRTPLPNLLDTEVLFPALIPEREAADILSVAERAVAAVDIDVGAVHLEIMRSPQGPVPVEIAARGPGFKVFTDMLPHVTGIDLLAETIRAALGESPRFDDIRARGAVLRFLAPTPGRITGITGLDQARSMPGVLDVQLYVAEGDVVSEVSCGDERVGHIIALGEDRDEAVSVADRATDLLRIETVPVGSPAIGTENDRGRA